MGRAVVRPTNGAAAPYGHARGSHCRVWLRNDWFACLGRRKETHRKIERWAGPCPQVGEPGIGYVANDDVEKSDSNNYGGDGDGTHNGATNYSEPTMKSIKNMQ